MLCFSSVLRCIRRGGRYRGLFIVVIVVITVIYVNAVIVLVVIAFGQVMDGKKQQRDSFGSI